MKNTVKRILSIVLVVALFATLGITAFASGTVTTSSEVPATLYLGGSTTTTATLAASCSESGHTVAWTSDKTDIISVSGTTATAVAVGTAKLTATCATCNVSAEKNIEVKCCAVAECSCGSTCKGKEQKER